MRKYFMLIMGIFRLIKEKIINLNKLKTKGFKYFLGYNVKIWLHSGGICDLGIKTWISDNSCFESNGGKIKLGYNNFFNSNCKIVSMCEISIGDNNLFAPNVVVIDHKHNYEDKNKLICKQGMSLAPVNIKSNVWICSNVVISQGVTIGNNIIIAANSVVNRNLIEPGIYAGSPAVLVKKL
jgi:maltose O-acetyltransferase